MQFSAQELSLCHFVMRLTEQVGQNGQPSVRTLSLDDMEPALSVNKKMKSFIKDNQFTAADLEFSTEEKAMLLKFLQRPWDIDNLEIVVELRKKLA